VRIGVPKEIKQGEGRVSVTPAGVRELVNAGHEVAVEAGAGVGAGFCDESYRAEAAVVVDTAVELFDFGELIVKVKEPQRAEVALLRPGQTLFTYLHLAAEPELAIALAETGSTAIAYETVVDAGGGLPLLAPMSEIAGRLAVHLGAHLMFAPQGGVGVLLGGVPGAPGAKVVVLGGGVAGEQSVAMALGLGAQVTVLDRSLPRLRALDARFGGRAVTAFSTEHALERALDRAHLLIGSVLVVGDRAPRLVRREHLSLLIPGAVVVDVAIDQGGCIETSRPTTHAEPAYDVDGIRHAAVTNLPGAVPVTATAALSHATLPFLLELANHGTDEALERDPALRAGLNISGGEVVHPVVAQAVAAGSGRMRSMSA
jgi:alanine dehydrogenase